jgi:hypothetical protein
LLRRLHVYGAGQHDEFSGCDRERKRTEVGTSGIRLVKVDVQAAQDLLRRHLGQMKRAGL